MTVRMRARANEPPAADVGGPPGPAHSFDDFYHAHFRSVTTQLCAYTGDLGQAQDLAQEAFTRALARWERLVRYDDPVAWVRRVAWNIAVSRWRRVRTARLFGQRQRPEVVDGPGPERVALAAALRTLPANQRRAVVLHYLAELTVAEIAEDCGVAPGTVKSWLHRARTALATCLTEHDPGQSTADRSAAAGRPTGRTAN